ncbi:hypothetical protein SDC9_82424 [bioreactor metagenome]|uniref:Uncharacterized protein n=1 Tax=bioreactor metagenome TaxID=1076179 RepID=A0A644Z4K8_9ZZZZ
MLWRKKTLRDFSPPGTRDDLDIPPAIPVDFFNVRVGNIPIQKPEARHVPVNSVGQLLYGASVHTQMLGCNVFFDQPLDGFRSGFFGKALSKGFRVGFRHIAAHLFQHGFISVLFLYAGILFFINQFPKRMVHVPTSFSRAQSFRTCLAYRAAARVVPSSGSAPVSCICRSSRT